MGPADALGTGHSLGEGSQPLLAEDGHRGRAVDLIGSGEAHPALEVRDGELVHRQLASQPEFLGVQVEITNRQDGVKPMG